MENKDLKIIQKEAEKILKLLKVEAGLSLKEEEGRVFLTLESEEPGLLIGYHGQTLASLELILNLVVSKKLGQWSPMTLDVADWRKNREEALREMAQNFAAKAKASGQPQVLPFLTSQERRVVHMSLAQNSDVVTISEGEGADRRLIIKPAT